MKFKRKTRKIIKGNEGDTYIFKNGVAIVPGCFWKKKPMTVTIKEFNLFCGG